MGRGDIERDRHVPARLEAAGEHGVDDDLQRVLVVLEPGTIAPLVAHQCRLQAALGKYRGHGTIHRHRHFEGVAIALGAHRHDEHVLDVKVSPGVEAARDHVHHGQGQHGFCADMVILAGLQPFPPEPVEMDEQLLALRRGRGMCDRQRDAQQRIGAQAALVRRAVERQQHRVERPLIVEYHAGHGRSDDGDHVRHRPAHTEAAVARAVGVAQLERLVPAGAGAEGTMARPIAPVEAIASTSTVGRPRESSTCRAFSPLSVIIPFAFHGRETPSRSAEVFEQDFRFLARRLRALPGRSPRGVRFQSCHSILVGYDSNRAIPGSSDGKSDTIGDRGPRKAAGCSPRGVRFRSCHFWFIRWKK